MSGRDRVRWVAWAAVLALFWLAPQVASGQCWGDEAKGKGYANAALLASTQEVADHLGETSVRILDARSPDRFAAGHIPGAVNLPVAEVTRTLDGVPGMLAPIQEVEQALGSRGVSPKTQVIVYDDFGGDQATRLFWVLEFVGHSRVSVLALSPDGKWLLVTRSEAGHVSVVDVQTMAVVGDIETGAGANYAVFSPEGKTAYVSNMEANTVSVIEVTPLHVTGTIAVRQGPGHMAMSPDGRRLYVANEGSGTLAVIEPGRAEVLGSVRVGNEPHGIAVSPDGGRVYVSSHEDGTVSVVDAGTLAVVRIAKVGTEPEHVEVTPAGRWIAVARPEAGEIVMLDAKDLALVRRIDVGKEPHQMVFPRGESLPITP